MLFAPNWNIGKKKKKRLPSKVLSNSSTSTQSLPYLPSKEGPSQSWWDSQGFSIKLLSIIPLNSQEETKIKINGKPCHILVDTWATLHSGACRCDCRKTGKSQRSQNSYRSQLSWMSVVPAWQRKVKFQVVPFFPNLDSLVVDLNSDCFLAQHVAFTGNTFSVWVFRPWI